MGWSWAHIKINVLTFYLFLEVGRQLVRRARRYLQFSMTIKLFITYLLLLQDWFLVRNIKILGLHSFIKSLKKTWVNLIKLDFLHMLEKIGFKIINRKTYMHLFIKMHFILLTFRKWRWNIYLRLNQVGTWSERCTKSPGTNSIEGISAFLCVASTWLKFKLHKPFFYLVLLQWAGNTWKVNPAMKWALCTMCYALFDMHYAPWFCTI